MEFLNLIDNIVENQSLYQSILEGNEAQTRWMLIDPLILDGLGFKRSDIIVEYCLDFETRKNSYNKLDYSLLIENKPKLLIEAKSLGVNLFEKREQLSEYFEEVLHRGVYVKNELIGVLTNGDVYLFYTNSVSIDKMDNLPYYSIQLSISEDNEKLKLLNYSYTNLNQKLQETPLIITDDEYELYSSYRIDMIDTVFNYFLSQNIDVEIHRVYLNGKISNIRSFSGLYKSLLKDINIRIPNLLYHLAEEEELSRNGKIIAVKFSMLPTTSAYLEVITNSGSIYATIPAVRKSILERIIYLTNKSGYGFHNILVSLKRKGE